MTIKAELSSSNKEGKRFEVILTDDNRKKTIHFGQKGGSTFIDHKDETKKSAWIARHKVRENWNDVFTAGFWAKHLLWNKDTIAESKRNIKNTYNIEFI